VNNAEYAPEICNEFVKLYMEARQQVWKKVRHQQLMREHASKDMPAPGDKQLYLPDIPKSEQIDLTINLCHWMFECQFTCSKLSLI